LNGTWIETTSSDWQWRSSFGGFFPIVEPDRLLCGAVENFRLEERGDDYAVVAWHPSRPFEGLYSGRYQVAVGGLGPASWWSGRSEYEGHENIFGGVGKKL